MAGNFQDHLQELLRENIKFFDIVYIVYVWNYPVAAASHYARKFGVPYIISPVGTLFTKTFSHKSWKKVPYFKLISERDLRNASAIHYTTPHESELCHKELNLSNKALVVPNGMNLSEYKKIPNPKNLQNTYPHLKGKKIILFLGRICWIKGLDRLIPAFAKLYEKRKDIHLLIVGNDEDNYAKEVKGVDRKI